MANLMKHELMDELTAGSCVKERSKEISPPVSELTQRVPSALPSHPGVSLVSASSVKSAVKPGRAYVPPPPRPALKTQPNASIKPMEQREAPVPSQEKATARPLGARTARIQEARVPEVRVPEARVPEARASVPDADEDVASAVKPFNPPSEKTQIFRPNLNDPTLRRSFAPVDSSVPTPEEVAFPKEPRLPTDVVAATKAREPSYPLQENASHLAPSNDSDGDTVTLSSDTIDKMLEGEKDATHSGTSPADEATRIGQIPAETLAALQRGTQKEIVGNDDVTRVYDSPLREKTDSTSPGQRQSRQIDNSHQMLTQPRVIIRQELPKKSYLGRWIGLGLCVAVLTAGWIYRAPLGKQAHALQAIIIRGIAPAAQKPALAADPLVAVSISVAPADAKLTLDGVPITNPFTVNRRSDRQPHQLVAEAPGHVSLERTVQFERDLTVMLALAPKPQVATPAAAVPTPEVPTTEPERAAPIARAARRAARPAAAAPVAAAAAAPSVNCEPPYTVDANGIKSYKPECM